VSTASFLLGIPCAYSYSPHFKALWSSIYGLPFLETLDLLVSTWMIPLTALLTSLFLGWVCRRDYLPSSGKWVSIWSLLMRWIIPAGIIFMVIEKRLLCE
ncbi:MAG: sodium-dependent transporter, partial [Chlamydiota bacterium]|nr:sodium-dependent transporter [Chlamydiota bacterium]